MARSIPEDTEVNFDTNSFSFFLAVGESKLWNFSDKVMVAETP